jgi:hypothetical protein
MLQTWQCALDEFKRNRSAKRSTASVCTFYTIICTICFNL